MTIEKRRNFLINTAYFVLIAAIIYFICRTLAVFFMPFLIGIFVSYIVQKPAKAISKKTRINNGVVTVFFVILTYAFIVLLLTVLGYVSYKHLSVFFTKTVSQYIPAIKSAFNNLNLKISQIQLGLPDDLTATLSAYPDKLFSSIITGAANIISNFGVRLVKTAPQMLISTIVTLVASCFIAVDHERIISFIKLQLSDKARDIAVDIKHLFTNSIFKMLKGYAFLMVITFCELCVFLGILGIKNFVFVAMIIAFVDILPVLGTGTVLIPWAIISLICGNYYHMAGLIIAYVIITIIRQFIEPKIIGEQIGLHPLVMLIALFVGLRLIGFVGMFAFPIGIIIISHLQKTGKIHLWKTAEESKTKE